MNWMPVILKYTAIGRVTIRNHLAYMADFLARSALLLVILYIFLQLWSATFSGEGGDTIVGYTYEQIIWYLIFAEAIAMAGPSLSTRIEEEVKNGDVAYKLVRPVSYIGYHYFSYLGETAIRMAVNLAVGGLLGWIVFGLPELGFGLLGFLLLAIGAVTVNFLLNMMIALCAFWVEETRGLEFVYNKLLFTIGGMLLPLEIFPELLQRISAWLPFQTVMYFPAKTAVRFDWAMMGHFVLIQWVWAAVLLGPVCWMYARGVRKINVNGG